MTLTALLVGNPYCMVQPDLKPGETSKAFVIRHYPEQWLNFLEQLRSEHGAPESLCALLKKSSGDIRIDDPLIRAVVDRFFQFRLPTSQRTLWCLSDLARCLNEEMIGTQRPGFELAGILISRSIRHRTYDQALKAAADNIYGQLVYLDVPDGSALDLNYFLPHIAGDFLWLIPGGTTFSVSLAIVELMRALTCLSEARQAALYFDGSLTVLYRTAALRDIVCRGHTLSPDLQENARMLQECGYLLVAQPRGSAPICELEGIYGGAFPFPKERRKKWWMFWA